MTFDVNAVLYMSARVSHASQPVNLEKGRFSKPGDFHKTERFA